MGACTYRAGTEANRDDDIFERGEANRSLGAGSSAAQSPFRHSFPLARRKMFNWLRPPRARSRRYSRPKSRLRRRQRSRRRAELRRQLQPRWRLLLQRNRPLLLLLPRRRHFQSRTCEATTRQSLRFLRRSIAKPSSPPRIRRRAEGGRVFGSFGTAPALAGEHAAAAGQDFGARLDGGIGGAASTAEPRQNWMLIAACIAVLFLAVGGGVLYFRPKPANSQVVAKRGSGAANGNAGDGRAQCAAAPCFASRSVIDACGPQVARA